MVAKIKSLPSVPDDGSAVGSPPHTGWLLVRSQKLYALHPPSGFVRGALRRDRHEGGCQKVFHAPLLAGQMLAGTGCWKMVAALAVVVVGTGRRRVGRQKSDNPDAIGFQKLAG